MRIISGVIVHCRRKKENQPEQERSLGDGQDYARNDYEDDHPKKKQMRK